jgi:hypothetical protein
VVFEIMVMIMKINVEEEELFRCVYFLSLWFKLDKAFSFVTGMIP